jgi:hypothetical protein
MQLEQQCVHNSDVDIYRAHMLLQQRSTLPHHSCHQKVHQTLLQTRYLPLLEDTLLSQQYNTPAVVATVTAAVSPTAGQLITSERGVCGGPLLSIMLTLCHILHSVSHWPVLCYFINCERALGSRLCVLLERASKTCYWQRIVQTYLPTCDTEP